MKKNCSTGKMHMNVIDGMYIVAVDAWRVGDTKLDWLGAQAGQGTYMGSPAFGTPLVWTANNSAKPEYQELIKCGDAYFMVDFWHGLLGDKKRLYHFLLTSPAQDCENTYFCLTTPGLTCCQTWVVNPSSFLSPVYFAQGSGLFAFWKSSTLTL